jgi:hypothetical protein
MDGLLMDGFPEMWVPQNIPKWLLSMRKTMVWGTHISGTPQIVVDVNIYHKLDSSITIDRS